MDLIGEYKPKKGEFPPGVAIRFMISENAKGLRSLVIRQGNQEVRLPMRVVDDLLRVVPMLAGDRYFHHEVYVPFIEPVNPVLNMKREGREDG
jgi:hypothetical protein